MHLFAQDWHSPWFAEKHTAPQLKPAISPLDATTPGQHFKAIIRTSSPPQPLCLSVMRLKSLDPYSKPACVIWPEVYSARQANVAPGGTADIVFSVQLWLWGRPAWQRAWHPLPPPSPPHDFFILLRSSLQIGYISCFWWSKRRESSG